MSIMHRALAPLLTLATSIALAYALFGLGFVACTTPQATAAIGGTFSGWENSVFPEEDMAAIAEATRAFSIEGAPINELSDAIHSALENSNPNLPKRLPPADLISPQTKAKPLRWRMRFPIVTPYRKMRFPTCKTAHPSLPRAAFRWELWGDLPL